MIPKVSNEVSLRIEPLQRKCTQDESDKIVLDSLSSHVAHIPLDS